ncbi:ABC transporter ATP-binding protein [Gordonia crocea]|uniref:Tetronasin ABC transporter ATP-binding protein n=1 Tax=Gordonia crocea TaxID=589162 RepID=A0A7I9UZ53_9ACTN|nr:ABC transporter ATP-binding protein [Gordonia crocea]GED98202.1 tetronasin ABC transporter ATP-binding protein [Gordonia crocea]
MNQIDVTGLVKRFGGFTAVAGLDLAVTPGQVHGFLGPNGAGKSTTIRTLLGLYRADAGSVSVLGADPARNAAAINRRLSYIAGDVAFWPNLTGAEVLDALAGLRGARRPGVEAELIERFGFDPGKKVRAYSKGNRQKLALIAAFAAPTELLILDEPTSGLDPLMERVFGSLVAQAAADGRGVLLSSHILAEVDRLCDYVTIIKDGRQVESAPLDALRHLSATTIRVGGARIPDVIDDVAALGLTPSAPESGSDGIGWDVPRADVPRVLGILAAHGVMDVTCAPASLEELFLRHYRTQAP